MLGNADTAHFLKQQILFTVAAVYMVYHANLKQSRRWGKQTARHADITEHVITV